MTKLYLDPSILKTLLTNIERESKRSKNKEVKFSTVVELLKERVTMYNLQLLRLITMLTLSSMSYSHL
jgi:hypothetical protein